MDVVGPAKEEEDEEEEEEDCGAHTFLCSL
jgi:hypothetical protein